MVDQPTLPARTRPEYILPESKAYLSLVQRIILDGLANQEGEIKFYFPNLVARAYTIVHEGESIKFSYVPTDALGTDDIKGEGF